MTTGIELIAAERARKQKNGTRTNEKDDLLECGELLDAAECYIYGAHAASGGLAISAAQELIEDGWPFNGSAMCSATDVVKNLVRAGALIAAEIDRIQRLPGDIKVESPDKITRTDVASVNSPFSEDDLTRLGFRKSAVGDGSTAFIHECGVIHTRGDGLWSYMAVQMRPFESIGELERFIASYNSLNPFQREINESFKNLAINQALASLGK